MAEGVDRMNWRHTLLVYSGSITQSRKSINAYYPYKDDFRPKPVSREDMEQSFAVLREMLTSRNRNRKTDG